MGKSTLKCHCRFPSPSANFQLHKVLPEVLPEVPYSPHRPSSFAIIIVKPWSKSWSQQAPKSCKVIDNSEVAQPTKSMESGQQTFYFIGMFLLKLAGHVTKLSINSNWLLVFILLSVIIFIGWRVYSCLVH